MVLLPALSFVLVFLCFHTRRSHEWRESFIYAAIVSGIYVVLSTETLNKFDCIIPMGVTLSWGFFLLVSFLIFLIRFKSIHWKFIDLKEYKPADVILLSMLGIILLLTALVAYIAPPNTWDSLTTHMSRVAHWIQNKSVDPYPTSILRQVNYPPWTGYCILHLQLLSDQTDRLANFVQWLSMAGSLIVVSLIAKKLGGNRHQQLASAIFAATLPIGILEATSTQTDYAANFWFACFVCAVISSMNDHKKHWLWVMGAVTGLSCLIKGTVLFYSLPFLIWWIISAVKQRSFKWIGGLLMVSLMVVFLNGIFWQRNMSLTGTIYPPKEKNMLNAGLSVPYFISNVTRGLALHFLLPNEKWNDHVEDFVFGVQRQLLKFSNDKRIQKDIETYRFRRHPFHDSIAGNFFHFILILLGLFLLLVIFTKLTRMIKIYVLCLLVGIFVFTWIIRWTPFHSRYQMPVFILLGPAVVMIFETFRYRLFVNYLTGICFLGSMPWLLYNETRPLIGPNSILMHPREDQYFYSNTGFVYSFKKAVEAVESISCQSIGLILTTTTIEYPFWILLKANQKPDVRLEHLNVPNPYFENEQKRYPLGEFKPCAIIDSERGSGATVNFDDVNYTLIGKTAFTTTYQLDPQKEILKEISISQFLVSTKQVKELVPLIANDLKQHTLFEKQKAPFLIREFHKISRQSQLVDTDYLNTLHSDLGIMFQSTFIKGVQLLSNGYESQNKTEIERGMLFLIKWYQWFTSNDTPVIRAIKKKVEGQPADF